MKQKMIKNKHGLSIVIGYVLLISISIVMSIIVFTWLRTYVPSEGINCDDGTSAFIKETNYDYANEKLTVTLRNNGKFDIDGYFIHVSNQSDLEQIATIDLSTGIYSGGELFGSSIRFDGLTENYLTPGDEILSVFNVSAEYGILTKVEIIPTRIQIVNGKKRFISCSNAKVDETLVYG